MLSGRAHLMAHRSSSRCTPILLCNAGYYGTLSAVRSLGRAGIPVVTVDPTRAAPARFSRYAGSHLRCPPFENTDEWAGWLLELGSSGPKRAIYATSDAVSFALARHREALAPFFHLYQPGLATIMSILDKGLLMEHARAVGMDTPETWLPRSSEEAEQIGREVGGPLLMKPRSQLATKFYSKGELIKPGRDNVRAAFDRFHHRGSSNADFSRLHPEAMMPLLQRYYPEAQNALYSLSGFRDRTGTHFVGLGARKLLQRPRRLGVGLCFEATEIPAGLADATRRLCDRIGYYGVFEVEFIISGGKTMVIDFNGRLYNQLAFDIARGAQLAGMAYAGAIGCEDDVSSLVAATPEPNSTLDMAFCNGFGLRITLAAQRAFGTMSQDEARFWRFWRQDRRRQMVDPLSDADDPMPAAVDAAHQIIRISTHPFAFVLQVGLAS